MSCLKGRKVFCIVSGASRGFGSSLAQSMAESVGPKSRLILLSRDRDALESVKSAIDKKSIDIDVKVAAIDLAAADISTFEQLIMNGLENDTFETAILIHNAASTGDVTKRLTDYRDRSELDGFWHLNVTSMLLLTNALLGQLKSTDVDHTVVVNISAPTAIKSRKGLHLYGSGKAARNALIRGLADEVENVRFLSYHPGTIDSRMFRDYKANTWDAGCRKWTEDAADSGVAKDPACLTQYLIDLMDSNQFVSGSFVDNQGKLL